MGIKKTVVKNNRNYSEISKSMIDSKPRVDFRYLSKTSKELWNVIKYYKNDKSQLKNYVTLLENFVYDFSECASYSEARRKYSSQNSGKKQEVKNKIDLKDLPKDVKEFISSVGLTHFHMKPNGKGKELIWGFENGVTFYILALDPEHELT